MKTTQMLSLAALLAASCLLSAPADEAASRARAAVAQGEKASFTMRILISAEIQGSTREAKVEVPAFLMDAAGLLVVPNPEAMMGGMMRGHLSTKGFQLVSSDGKESEAKVVGRDNEFGLLFLKLTDKGALSGAATPAVRTKAAELGDEMFILRRHSAAHPDPVCEMSRVACVVQKPRLMYLLSENVGPGCAALSGEGELIGLTVVVTEQDPDSGRANPMLVVLPMAQLAEVAKGLKEGAAEEKPKAEEKPEPKPEDKSETEPKDEKPKAP